MIMIIIIIIIIRQRSPKQAISSLSFGRLAFNPFIWLPLTTLSLLWNTLPLRLLDFHHRHHYHIIITTTNDIQWYDGLMIDIRWYDDIDANSPSTGWIWAKGLSQVRIISAPYIDVGRPFPTEERNIVNAVSYHSLLKCRYEIVLVNCQSKIAKCSFVMFSRCFVSLFLFLLVQVRSPHRIKGQWSQV